MKIRKLTPALLMTSFIGLALVSQRPTHAKPAADPPEVGAPSTHSQSHAGLVASSVLSLDGPWLLATDPKNIGRDQQWFSAPRPEAKSTKVPWIIQDAFPAYHGVAWYWRPFTPPANPHEAGRYLLRFWAVDYKADVWLNGMSVGGHEGGETPFILDVTEVIKPKTTNWLAVRVLNPSNERIDGMVLAETPHRNKVIPYSGGSSYDHGGIVDSVDLWVAPAVRIEDLFARADPNTGKINLRINLRNATTKAAQARLECMVAPAASGETLSTALLPREIPPGDTSVEVVLAVPNPRLWELNDPYLYRVTARVSRADSVSIDEQSVRCGFRDFRFENGCFRLNGRRIFLRCSHTGNHCPIGQQLPPDPDFLRRDLLNVKVMGFNAIRFIAGVATRQQLDLCDELGLMVYEEPYAGWCLADSPQMAARFDESALGMVRRDRNHPSVTMWGLLNETGDGPVFRHAVAALPKVRELDNTRLVMLNSGRFDNQAGIGSLSNPGSNVWEDLLSDKHPYQGVPHTAAIIRNLRTMGGGKKPLFISEYGVGSAVDLWRVARHYERFAATHAEDARFYRDKLDKFLLDWQRWRMADIFGRPEDFFAASLKKMAGQRLLGLNAIRSNPNIVAHSLTGTVDQGMSGEGLFTTFRELKPGTVDALFDGWAPLRWCLFVEPVNLFQGARARFDAVLANEDMLAPGEYPVRLEVFGPDNQLIWSRQTNVLIRPAQPQAALDDKAATANPQSTPELPFVLPVLKEDVAMEGPAGKYRFVATMERGAAPMGGEAEFYLADPAQMPPIQTEVVVWGQDDVLAKWLADHGIRHRPFNADAPALREVILAGAKPPAPGGAEVFREIARRISRGATAIFLAPEVFAQGNNPVAWVPLARKGALRSLNAWLYHKDEWAKAHPIFDGLPTGMMDYTFYREIIPNLAWTGQDAPSEAVAGANDASIDYAAGLLLSVHDFGAGHFILNSLRIRENLGQNPAAERLLRNLVRFAARDQPQPPTDLPVDFDAQLRALGYE